MGYREQFEKELKHIDEKYNDCIEYLDRTFWKNISENLITIEQCVECMGKIISYANVYQSMTEKKSIRHVAKAYFEEVAKGKKYVEVDHDFYIEEKALQKFEKEYKQKYSIQDRGKYAEKLKEMVRENPPFYFAVLSSDEEQNHIERRSGIDYSEEEKKIYGTRMIFQSVDRMSMPVSENMLVTKLTQEMSNEEINAIIPEIIEGFFKPFELLGLGMERYRVIEGLIAEVFYEIIRYEKRESKEQTRRVDVQKIILEYEGMQYEEHAKYLELIPDKDSLVKFTTKKILAKYKLKSYYSEHYQIITAICPELKNILESGRCRNNQFKKYFEELHTFRCKIPQVEAYIEEQYTGFLLAIRLYFATCPLMKVADKHIQQEIIMLSKNISSILSVEVKLQIAEDIGELLRRVYNLERCDVLSVLRNINTELTDLICKFNYLYSKVFQIATYTFSQEKRWRNCKDLQKMCMNMSMAFQKMKLMEIELKDFKIKNILRIAEFQELMCSDSEKNSYKWFHCIYDAIDRQHKDRYEDVELESLL